MTAQVYAASYPSPTVGTVDLVAGDAGLREVGWGLRSARTASRAPHPTVQAAVDQLREYFAGERTDFDLPLDLARLDPTNAAVLTAMRTVGYGETITYGELARRSGTGLPARAIGAIMGANPVPLVIPCHRIVAADGLGGYSGGPYGQGVATKRTLLELEGALPPALL